MVAPLLWLEKKVYSNESDDDEKQQSEEDCGESL